MIKIKIVVIEKTKAPFLVEGEKHYLKRLKRYMPVEWSVIKPVKMRKRSPHEILEIEKKAIEKMISNHKYIVSLDVNGKEFTSEQLAAWLNNLINTYNGWVCFILGGPFGISQEIIKRSHLTLSLSRLTLTHEMSRLIFLEQLYRAFSMIKGEPYHK